jgi:hypothetical protein
MSFTKKDDFCASCKSLKTVELGRIDNDGLVLAVKEVDPEAYRRDHFNVPDEPVLRVYCSNCGMMYHEDSV